MPLTTIDKVKSYLQITTTTDDAFISDLITNVQSLVENYCDRNFDSQIYTMEQHTAMHKVFPFNYPIISVQAIRRSGIDIANIDTQFTSYRIHPSYIELLDYKYVTMGNKFMWANHEESYVEIDYTAGYTVIPGDLSLAATKLVALEYKESRENRLGVESESEGAVKYIYSKKDEGIPLQISSVLDKYSKVRV